MKNQHLLLKNNTFVVLHIIYSTRTIRKLTIYFVQPFDSCFWWIPGAFTKETYCIGHQKGSFSKYTLHGATAASFCRISDREEALESSNAVL